MKSLISLSTALLDDMGSICSVETTRDLDTLRNRAEHEGEQFFTLTLPAFAEDFESSLEEGRINSTLFAGWKRAKGAVYPAFLQGFTSLVFTEKGVLCDEPSVSAIYAVRQFCRFLKKVRTACSNERVKAAFERYATIEAEFKPMCGLSEERLHHFARVSDLLWLHVFGSGEFNSFELVPKHGPGATADRISGNRKYSHLCWHTRLERTFPFLEYIFASLNQMDCNVHGINNVCLLPEDQELPVRVITVPKTLKAPRIIAIEPVCMQYTQQAVLRWLVDKIERSKLIGGSIRFTSQDENKRMAILASASQLWSTIDLSDASDRVPYDMVRLMLASQPELLQAIDDSRSRRAQLPDGRIIDLKKFASMGSALCFPIEAMYFATVIVHGQLWELGQDPTYSEIRRILSRLHLFGDDIIVPVQETEVVMQALAAFNCKVNTTKSFHKGLFRESCGVDAYAGVDITPVYLRELEPASSRDSVGLLSWIATSNQLHMAGCWRAADYMKSVVERVLGKLPTLFETSPGLGWLSFNGCVATGECMKLHRPVVKTYKVRAIKQRDPLDGYPALLKYFLTSSEDGASKPARTMSESHLLSSVSRGAISRKRHWVPVV